jgi:hypothetical protein
MSAGRLGAPEAANPDAIKRLLPWLVAVAFFMEFFGCPTWARTRDLRINRLAVDRPASPHECLLFGVAP